MHIGNQKLNNKNKKGEKIMGRVSPEEASKVITSLIMRGESCNSCKHNNVTYGDCPYEPDARSQKPNVSGNLICHRHSNGPLSKS